MSKMSKAIAVLGVVAGLGVAALPLSTYAALGDSLQEGAYTQNATAQVRVEVGGAISIATSIGTAKATDNKPKMVNLGELMPGSIVEATEANTLNVQVTSNGKDAKYGLYINSLNGKTAMVGDKTGDTIDTLADGATLTAGTSAWGYKLDDATDYVGIPATAKKIVDTKVLTDTTPGTTDVDKHTIKFGVAASTTQTPDIYTGTVVFTAALEN